MWQDEAGSSVLAQRTPVPPLCRARNRSAQARERRELFRKEYDLKVTIPERRFSEADAEARQKAESIVPMTPEDRLASNITAGLPIGCLATALLAILGFGMGSLWLGPSCPGRRFCLIRIPSWSSREA